MMLVQCADDRVAGDNAVERDGAERGGGDGADRVLDGGHARLVDREG